VGRSLARRQDGVWVDGLAPDVAAHLPRSRPKRSQTRFARSAAPDVAGRRWTGQGPTDWAPCHRGRTASAGRTVWSLAPARSGDRRGTRRRRLAAPRPDRCGMLGRAARARSQGTPPVGRNGRCSWPGGGDRRHDQVSKLGSCQLRVRVGDAIVGDAARIARPEHRRALRALPRFLRSCSDRQPGGAAVIVVYEARAGRAFVVTVRWACFWAVAIGNLIDRLPWATWWTSSTSGSGRGAGTRSMSRTRPISGPSCCSS